MDGIVGVGDSLSSVFDGWGHIGIGLHGAGVISSAIDGWDDVGIRLGGLEALSGVIDG